MAEEPPRHTNLDTGGTRGGAEETGGDCGDEQTEARQEKMVKHKKRITETARERDRQRTHRHTQLRRRSRKSPAA